MKVPTLAVLVVGLLLAACSEPAIESQGSGQAAPASPTTQEPAEPSAPAEEPDNLVAANQFRFSIDEIELTAGDKTEFPFVNNDPAPHNISIYVSEGGKRLFKGKPVGDGERVIYQIPPLKKGRYYFVCDIHPVMEGEVVVR